MERSMTLAEALPAEIKRVRTLQDQFKQLRGLPNVMVEPQIAMMEMDLDAAIAASAQGDVVAMLNAHNALHEWEG